MVNTKTGALLVVWFEVPDEFEEEFHAWYNTEHVPERETIPGFHSARRFVAVHGGPRFFAFYDLEDASVLTSAAYQAIVGKNESPWTTRVRSKAILLVRSVYQQMPPLALAGSGAGLLVETAEIPPDAESDFYLWYEQEHAPQLVSLPDLRSARPFRALEGKPQFLALYEFGSADGVPQDACLQSGDLLQQTASSVPSSWQSHLRCAVYKQIYPPVGNEHA